MIALAFKLLIAHFIGDFVAQPDHWVKEKEYKGYRSKYLYIHMLVHMLAMGCLLQFKASFFIVILIISISHYFIDLGKIHLKNKINPTLLFFLDQSAHLSVITIVIYHYYPFTILWEYVYSAQSLILILFLLLVSFVTSTLMKVIMSLWDLPEDDESDSLKNGGKIIGILERLLIFGFIVLNQWQAIGLLIAAKSVFRFGDLSRSKDRKLTEYILIGTLMSFGIAIAIGLFYKFLSNIVL